MNGPRAHRADWWVGRGLLLAAACFLLVGCYRGPAPAAGAAASSSPTGPVYTVHVAQATVNGGTRTVLADAQGFTLYYRSRDATGSVCSGGCANIWPPLLQPAGAPTADPALTGILGTAANANGNQVLYNGHPLYRYSGDAGPGQANGEGSGGIWFVVEP